MRHVIQVVVIILVSGLVGCTGKQAYHEPIVYQPRTDIDLSDDGQIINALNHHFTKWVGTPYRDGGMNKRGVDCSGFVLQTYATLFGIPLPRTTRQQVRSGRKITRSALKPSDLVFFKTTLFNNHVGIYRGNGQFMHVSTTRGVSLSNLDDSYWRDHFWQARRIFD